MNKSIRNGLFFIGAGVFCFLEKVCAAFFVLIRDTYYYNK
jgi:hypothetical protein